MSGYKFVVNLGRVARLVACDSGVFNLNGTRYKPVRRHTLQQGKHLIKDGVITPDNCDIVSLCQIMNGIAYRDTAKELCYTVLYGGNIGTRWEQSWQEMLIKASEVK